MKTILEPEPINLDSYRNTGLTSTAVAVKAGGGNIFGYRFVNPNTVPVYVKLYDKAQGGTVVGTDTPKHVVTVPAGDGTTPGAAQATNDGVPGYTFVTAITMAAVTGLADASTAAPSTAIYAEVDYK